MNPAVLLIDHDSLETIAIGRSAVLYGIDERSMLKGYFDEGDDAIAVECCALERLSSRTNIVKCLGKYDNRSVILERGTPILTEIGPKATTTVSLTRKLQWIRDAAEGLRDVHREGILHADFGCPSIVLVEDRAKIMDFGGCSIDGSELCGAYNWYSRHESTSTSLNVRTDIFAFGCAVYEILVGKAPYHEFEKCPDRDKRVQELYSKDCFPEVALLPLRELILGCWHGTFSSMNEVIDSMNIPDRPSQRTSNLKCDILHKIVQGAHHFKSIAVSTGRRIRSWTSTSAG